MQTIQYKKSRIWEMKEDKRPNQQPGLYDISYARY